MARILLSADDIQTVGGTNDELIFNDTGSEHLTLLAGTTGTVFGFQHGGEEIVLAGDASNYSVKAVGANIVLTSADGTNLVITAGSNAGTLTFANGDSRSLSILNGAVVLGGQALVQGADTPLTPGPGAPSDSTGPGQTFVLTDNLDTIPGLVGSKNTTDNSHDDTILATQTTLNQLDNIDGGAGHDRLQVTDSGTFFTPEPDFTNATISNVEQIDYVSTRGFLNGEFDSTTGSITGLKVLNASLSNTGFGGGGDQTITTDSDMQAINVAFNSSGNDLFINGGGGALSVTATTGSNITVGGGTEDNNFTSATINGGDNISITDNNGDATLQTVVLKGFDGSATIDAVGVTSVSLTNLDSASNDVTISGGADLAINLNNVNNSGIDFAVNGMDKLTVNADGPTVNVGDLNTDAASLTLSATGTDLTLDTVTDANLTGATGLNINAAGGDVAVISIADMGDNLTINISGSNAVAIDTLRDDLGADTAIVSTNSGSVTIGTQLDVDTSYTGGAGVDTLKFGATAVDSNLGGGDDSVRLNAAALGTGGSIDGGTGTDTLSMTVDNAAAISQVTNNGLSNFDKLDLDQQTTPGVSQAIDLANVGLTGPTYVVAHGATAANTLEATRIEFTGTASGADQVTFDGTTVNFADGEDASAMAATFVAQYGTGTNYTAVDNFDGTVTLTARATGDQTDLTAAAFTFTDALTIGAPSITNVTTTTQGVTGVAPQTESATLTLTSASVAGGETITIGAGAASFTYTNGAAADPAVNSTGGVLAAAIVAAANGDADFSAVYTAVQNGDNVTFTAKNPGDLPNLSLSGDGLTAADSYSFNTTSQGVTGVTAVQEVFTADVSGAASGNDTIAFDGITWTADGTEGNSDAVANAFATYYEAQAGRHYDVSVSGSTLTFTAIAAGSLSDATAGDFTVTDDVGLGTPGVAIDSISNGGQGGLVLDNFSSNGGTLEIAAGLGGGVYRLNIASDTTSDDATVLLSGHGVPSPVVVAQGYETVTLDSGAVSVAPSNDTVVLVDNAATHIIATGDDNLTVFTDLPLVTATAITDFDASTLTGHLTWTTGALADAATITTGDGGSTIHADAATDVITFNGGAGADVVTVVNGNDNVLNGGDGNDTLTVGSGANTVHGDAGNDLITVGNGANTIDGGAGDDHIVIGTGANAITLGAGADQVDLSVPVNGNSYSHITDFSAADHDSLNIAGAHDVVDFSTAQITLAATAVFQDFLDAAVAGSHTTGDVSWFEFGGNTYVVEDLSGAANTFQNNHDLVVQLQGTNLGLDTATLTGGSIHFA